MHKKKIGTMQLVWGSWQRATQLGKIQELSTEREELRTQRDISCLPGEGGDMVEYIKAVHCQSTQKSTDTFQNIPFIYSKFILIINIRFNL